MQWGRGDNSAPLGDDNSDTQTKNSVYEKERDCSQQRDQYVESISACAGCAKTVCTDDSTGALTNQNTLNYELCGTEDGSARVYVMSPRFVCSWSYDYYYMEKQQQQK